jgi:hypothetical protein
MHVFRTIAAMFTGPDGETMAIGRIYSVPMLFVGLALPVVKVFRHEPIGLEEFAIELPALAGALTIMISGTNHVDTPGAGMFTQPKQPV